MVFKRKISSRVWFASQRSHNAHEKNRKSKVKAQNEDELAHSLITARQVLEGWNIKSLKAFEYFAGIPEEGKMPRTMNYNEQEFTRSEMSIVSSTLAISNFPVEIQGELKRGLTLKSIRMLKI